MSQPKRINRGQQTDTPKVQRLQKGQEVIARFQDDGWFYCGKVVSELEDQTNYFDILDGTGQVERIHDNDIFVPEESIEPLKVKSNETVASVTDADSCISANVLKDEILISTSLWN